MAAQQNELIIVAFPLFMEKCEVWVFLFVCSYLNTVVEDTKPVR